MTALRNAGAVIGAVALLITACGGDNSETVVVPTTTADAEGGISFDTEQADQAVPSEGEFDFVTVVVELPEGVVDGTVAVVLEDITLADAEALELERVEMTTAELIEREGRVDVLLPVPLDGTLDLNAAVHVDVDNDGTVTAGDWVSPALSLVTPDAVAALYIGLQPA
ncbi:MAG: hypothetical protein AAGD35_21960 [Actinomycetota bacterium]